MDTEARWAFETEKIAGEEANAELAGFRAKRTTNEGAAEGDRKGGITRKEQKKK
jgi:hypothetical protein